MNATLESVDKIIDNQEVNGLDIKFHPIEKGKSIALTALSEDKLGVGFIGTDKKAHAAIILNGKMQLKSIGMTLQSPNCVSICNANDNEHMLLAFGLEGGSKSISFNKIKVADATEIINGSLGDGSKKIQGLSVLNTGQFYAVLYAEEVAADNWDVKLHKLKYDLTVDTAPTYPLTVNTETAGNQQRPSMAILSDNKMVVVFQGNGQNVPQGSGNGSGIYYQFFTLGSEIVKEAAENNVFVIGQPDLLFEYPEIQKITNDSFAISWTLQGSLYFSKYNLANERKCMEVVDGGVTKNSMVVSEESGQYFAYIAYEKQNKSYAVEVDTQDCTPERDPVLLQEALKQVSLPAVVVSKAAKTQILGIIYELEVDNAAQTFVCKYSEYFIKQVSQCPQLGCYGCHGSETCAICGGSSAEVRILGSRNKNDQCKCFEGYYQNNQDINCIKCERQCKTCDSNNKCLQCKSSDMMLPDCTYKQQGYYQYKDQSGNFVYKKCAPKCDYCENVIDGYNKCKSCNGTNREQAGNCNCLKGFHDNNEELQDCIKCSDGCLECSKSNNCIMCDESKNLEADMFTGFCKCKQGYKIFDLEKKECKKCYRLSDGCVEQCPKETIQMEKEQICQYIELNYTSNTSVIIIMAVAISLFQVGMCCFLYKRLRGKQQNFESQDLEEQAKLKQQRDYIYRNFDRTNIQIEQSGDNSYTTQMFTDSPMKRQLSKKKIGMTPNEIDEENGHESQLSYSDIQQSNIQLIKDHKTLNLSQVPIDSNQDNLDTVQQNNFSFEKHNEDKQEELGDDEEQQNRKQSQEIIGAEDEDDENNQIPQNYSDRNDQDDQQCQQQQQDEGLVDVDNDNDDQGDNYNNNYSHKVSEDQNEEIVNNNQYPQLDQEDEETNQQNDEQLAQQQQQENQSYNYPQNDDNDDDDEQEQQQKEEELDEKTQDQKQTQNEQQQEKYQRQIANQDDVIVQDLNVTQDEPQISDRIEQLPQDLVDNNQYQNEAGYQVYDQQQQNNDEEEVIGDEEEEDEKVDLDLIESMVSQQTNGLAARQQNFMMEDNDLQQMEDLINN